MEAYTAVLLAKRVHMLAGAYHMTLTADRPDNRRRDLSNLLKPTEDLLQYAQIVADDCNAERITLEWSTLPPAKPAQVHVTIEGVA